MKSDYFKVVKTKFKVVGLMRQHANEQTGGVSKEENGEINEMVYLHVRSIPGGNPTAECSGSMADGGIVRPARPTLPPTPTPRFW